ncbi:MAG: hypothetical protein ABW080_19725 [Candidatus Thiodiazotropha sp.]
MGQLKEHHLQQEQEQEIRLADLLGLSVEVLQELSYVIDPNYSSEGLLYGYFVRFSDSNDPSILENIPSLRADRTAYFAPWEIDPEPEPENEYEFRAITEDNDYLSNFSYEMEDLKKLLNLGGCDRNLERILNRQIFISVIGAMETYLSDAFINEVGRDTYWLRSFVKHHPYFKKHKIALSDIFEESERIEAAAKKVMLETIYHKLPVVKQMYEQTFEIAFPDISRMQGYIEQRHDLVHRNGKSTDGVEVDVSKPVIVELMGAVSELVEGVSTALLGEGEAPF